MTKIEIEYTGQTRPAKAGVDIGRGDAYVLTPQYYDEIFKRCDGRIQS